MAGRTYGTVAVAAVPVSEKRRAASGRGNQVLLWFVIFLMVLSAAGLLYFVFSYDGNEYAEVKRMGDEIASIANDVPQTEETDASDEPGMEIGKLYSRDPMDRELNWDGILEINASVGCWLYIPDMPIDYAVLHEPYSMEGNEYFYLRHDIYGNKSSSGWIFSVDAPGDTEDMHQLMFGHNMGSGKDIMFGTLQEYKDKEFCEAHPYIYVYYPDRAERWAVWSTCNVSGDDMVYSMPYESGSSDYAKLLLSLKDRAEYNSGVTVPYSTEKVLTLSTCDRGYGGSSGRYIVNAVLDSVKYTETGETVSAQEYYESLQ